MKNKKEEKQYLIKWQRKDYFNLIKAVNKYNKRIEELEKMDLDISLPKKIRYKDLYNKKGELIEAGVKSDILTRKQLNQTLSTLKRINFKSAIDEIKLQSGEVISKWEYNDIMKRKNIAEEYLRRKIDEERRNTSFKGISNDKLDKLTATLETIENFEDKKGRDLRYALNRIKTLGNIDYEIKKADTFKTNFMGALKEGASNFKNYKLLNDKLKSIRNPKEFYNFVSQSDTLMDLFLWYDDETGLIQTGAFKNNEEGFNDALVKLGFDIEF